MKEFSKRPTFYSLGEMGWAGGMGELMLMAGMRKGTVAECDVLIYNGGQDISTSIYNEQPIQHGIPGKLSIRDEKEIEAYEKFGKRPGVLNVGICRGGQLLNCLNGGTLWQDVNNHHGSHPMFLVNSERKIRATSVHHQMMRPNWDEVVLLAYSDESTQKLSEHDSYPYGQFPDDHKDVEVCWYPKTNCLCIQGHPEYAPGGEYADYCVELIYQYLAEAQLKCAA